MERLGAGSSPGSGESKLTQLLAPLCGLREVGCTVSIYTPSDETKAESLVCYSRAHNYDMIRLD